MRWWSRIPCSDTAHYRKSRNVCPLFGLSIVVHSADPGWNLAAVTRGVDAAIDVRVAISATVRGELIEQGIDEGKIRLIPSGVDLERFCGPWA